MQRKTEPESMKEIREQLQPQTKKRGIYHGIDTRDAEPSVVKCLLNNPGFARDLLSPHLDVDNFSRSARTCRGSNTMFKPLLPISRAAHYVIVKPSVVEIKKILDKLDLDSLKTFLQKEVNNVLGQSRITYVNMTLLQLAYSAGDDEMCLVLEPYFERAFGSQEAAREEIRKQLNEKFAEGSEVEKAQREARELEIKNQLQGLLATVIQAITNEKFNHGRDAAKKLILSPATLDAITTFRKALDALQPKIIDKGMHFRYNTLQEIYDTYAQAAAQWGYDYNRCALFEDGVVVAALLNVPENDAQKFSQGLYYLQNNPTEACGRSLKLRDTETNFYDSLRLASVDFSGLSGSCVDIICGGVGRARSVRARLAGPARVQAAQILFRTKTSNLQSLRGRSDLRQYTAR